MNELIKQLDLNGKLYKHLQSRHLNFDVHHVWLDEVAEIATFPLYNLRGQLLGYQQYRPSGSKTKSNNPYLGKYFTKKPTSCEPVYWGAESWNLSNTLFLVEGLFDAARITSLGYSALAVFTCNPGANFGSFISLVQKFRKVVAICDADDAGKALATYAHYSCVLSSGKDADEAEEQELTDILNHY